MLEEQFAMEYTTPNGDGPHAAGAEFGCPECEEWHKLLIDEARMLAGVGLGITAAIVGLALVLYLRGRFA